MSWTQGDIVELDISDLSDRGDGVGRWQDRVVFTPDTVPGDRVEVRLVRVKPAYGFGKLLTVLQPSPQRVRPACIVADKCGGCQWQTVSYPGQLAAKTQQLLAALCRIGGFEEGAIAPLIRPIVAAPEPLAYRNKATYPLHRTPDGYVQAGYYRKGSHQLINLNQCPVQDERLNPLLAGIKQDIEFEGWSIYNETKHQGKLRHLALRVGRRTGEILLTLVSKDAKVPGLAEKAETWLTTYPGLVGVCLNHNPERTNAIFGPQTYTVAGKDYLEEAFAGLTLHIQPHTFFQVYTEQAEQLLALIQQALNLSGTETLIDAYCGIGTLALPLARQARQVLGLEDQPEAVAQARANAALNGIANARFEVGTVEALLPLVMDELDARPDVVLLDPPRKGCDRTVLDTLIQLQAPRLVYMSCNPATLARDLKLLCGGDHPPYQIQFLQPADFFPQTAHVECVAFLNLTPGWVAEADVSSAEPDGALAEIESSTDLD